MSKNQIKLNKRTVFYGLFLLLLLLVAVRSMFRLPFPQIVFLAIAAVMVCIGQRDEILAVAMICLPMTTVFTHDYVILVIIAVILVKYRTRIRVDLTVVPVLFLILWELLHGLTDVFSIRELVVIFTPFLLFAVLMWQDLSDMDYGLTVRCLAVSTCTICLTLLGMVVVQSGFDFAAAAANMQRLGTVSEETTREAFEINPNSLGILCTLSITGLIQLTLLGQRKRWDIPMVLVMLVIGALTMSRTYLVLLLIMVLLFFLGHQGSFGKKLKLILAVVFLAAVSVGILVTVFPEAAERFVRRLSSSDITSGRTDLLRDYNAFLKERPDVLFYGIGLSDFSTRILSDYAVSFNCPHNGIQEALLAWGIPGTAMFAVLIGMMIQRGRQCAGKLRLVNFIPLILILAKVQAGQMLTSAYTMLSFAFAYLSLCQNFDAADRKNDPVLFAAKFPRGNPKNGLRSR